MKALIWTLVGLAALTPVILYLYQRWRASIAEKKGVAVYATAVSVVPVKAFGKASDIMKITMWLQEPGETRREVVLKSRVDPTQKITAGMMLPVVIDPKDKKKVYPAGAEALKRMQLTGSRMQRRQMSKQKM